MAWNMIIVCNTDVSYIKFVELLSFKLNISDSVSFDGRQKEVLCPRKLFSLEPVCTLKLCSDLGWSWTALDAIYDITTNKPTTN